MSRLEYPPILCFSGLDPSGGAGIQADIEAVAAQRAHALPVISCLTVQNTCDVARVESVECALLDAQIRSLADDLPIKAIKIGLLANPEQSELLARWKQALAVPTVLDPVLRAGSGTDLSCSAIEAAMRQHLLPQLSLLTPNLAEARRLLGQPQSSAEECAAALLQLGCQAVLITGGDEPDLDVGNFFADQQGAAQWYRWPRLPGSFHGSGCTLAAACAALLGHGLSTAQAVFRAQAWVAETLKAAHRPGKGQALPRRIKP